MGDFDETYPKANAKDDQADGRDGFGDDGGTRVGKPDPADKTTGAGAEATRSTGGKAKGHDRERKSGYGGDGSEETEKG
jgi:hypothetical protein